MDPFAVTAAAVAIAAVMARLWGKSNDDAQTLPPSGELMAILRQHSGFAGLSSATQVRVATALRDAAAVTGTPLAQLLATVDIESDFHPDADNGIAYGLGQQLPVYSGYFSDRCWNDARRAPTCSGPDSRAHNLTPSQLKSDVEQAARITARNIGHLIRQHGVRGGSGRYFAGSNYAVPAAQRYADAYEAALALWSRRLQG